MKRKRNKRLLITFTLILTVFAVLVINVFVVSVKGYHFNSKTNIKETVKDIHTVYEPIIAKRGRILDLKGDILVEDHAAYTLYAYIGEDRFDGDEPAYVVDKEATADVLSKVLKVSYDYVMEQLSSDSKQVEFGVYGKEITQAQKEELDASGLPGLGYMPVLVRGYYSSSLGSTLIGMTRFDEDLNRQQGIMGVEQYYDDVLNGKNGVEVYRQDRDQYRFDTIDQLSEASEPGKDITLTIDKVIQASLDNALNNILKHPGIEAKEAWGTVVDIKTGRILALSDAPSFNLEDPDTLYLNRATEYAYEPGSTLKSLTYAMALNEGAIKPDDLYNGNAYYIKLNADGTGTRVGSDDNYDAKIQNPFDHQYGSITMKEGYQRSSNVMIAEIMDKYLYQSAFQTYMKDLGFFAPVNFGKIPEAKGQELWDYYLEKITNGFGQGSTVTMLQLVQAHTAIFGDGTVVKPYIVEKITNPETGEVEYQAETQKGKKVFSDEAVQLTRDAMSDNVENKPYGMGRFKMNDVHVMAKSGTSQIVVDGKYSSSEFLFSAMLGFPYEDPQYAVYFAYRTHDYHNNIASADEIKNVIKTVITNYPIETTVEEEDQTVHNINIDNYVNAPVSHAIDSLKAMGHNPVVIGDGAVVIDQIPPRNTLVLNNEKIFLKTNSKNIKIPNMKGWSQKEVITYMNFIGVEFKIKGKGFVESQSLTPGTVISPEVAIEIVLQ